MQNFSPETISTVKKLVPMDDVMLQKICEDKAVCQELISAILAEQVVVESVVPQDSILIFRGVPFAWIASAVFPMVLM